MSTVLVTGGAGFIGSNFVRHALQSGYTVVNLDKLTYAGNADTLADLENEPHHVFIRGDIGDRQCVSRLLTEYRPDAVVHLAAESHVDRSVDGPAPFVATNVAGTLSLLECVRDYWQALPQAGQAQFRFLQVSTDEVYGSLGTDGRFTETTPFAPNSPYAASKAGADHMVRAFHHTWGLPTLTSHCSNNYGPYQFPEKLIPLMLHKALAGEALPVYGDGQHVRDWLYVDDHCRALERVLTAGRPGASYNIGGNAEYANLTLVKTLCELLDARRPRPDGEPHASAIGFVSDRPGHDRRYAIDANRMRTELDWQPTESFHSGLSRTVDWYLDHQQWVQRVLDGSYRLQRLGGAE